MTDAQNLSVEGIDDYVFLWATIHETARHWSLSVHGTAISSTF